MVCAPDRLPLLKVGKHEAVSYEARWLSDEIRKAARKVGHADWFFAPDVTRAVTVYLRDRFPKNTITLEELYAKIGSVLEYLGCTDIAEALEISPPPVRISLKALALEAGAGFELAFFNLLGERLEESERLGCEQIVCDGLRAAAKRLCGAARWSHACEHMAGEIVDFAIAEMLRHRPEGEVGLIVR